MSKQVQDAYIVSATRLPIGKSGRGYFKNTRPDEMLVKVMQAVLAQAPGLDPAAIEDAIVGCSFPEGEQGMNIARVASVLAGLGNTIGGVTVNLLRLRHHRRADGGGSHPRGRGRRDVRRRRRVHVHDPHGWQQAVPEPADFRA